MFARNPHFHLAPDGAAEFTQAIEGAEITPLQKGFQDEITFVTPNGTEVVGISLWGEPASCEKIWLP